MKHLTLIIITLLFSLTAQSETCPDPATSSLQYGIIPPPWQENPFSAHAPQGEKGARFVRANILVAGIGRGVVCNYKNSIGYYSIWWPVGVKIPARVDYNWLEGNMGYNCTISPEACVFYVAQDNCVMATARSTRSTL